MAFCLGVALGQVQRERVIHVMNSMLEELIGEGLAAIQAGKRARIQ